MSWLQLLQRTDEVVRGLARLYLKSQDRFGVWSTNYVEWILLQQVAARAGIILINVNPAYRSHELAYVLHKSRMRAIVLQEKDARANYNEILDEAIGGDAVPLEHRILIGDPSWDRMVVSEVDFEPR